MPATGFHTFRDQQRSNWVRMRTLITLRWVAIVGQITAILVAIRVFGLQIEVGLAVLVIMASVIANVASTYAYPESKRLSESQATLWRSRSAAMDAQTRNAMAEIIKRVS